MNAEKLKKIVVATQTHSEILGLVLKMDLTDTRAAIVLGPIVLRPVFMSQLTLQKRDACVLLGSSIGPRNVYPYHWKFVHKYAPAHSFSRLTQICKPLGFPKRNDVHMVGFPA